TKKINRSSSPSPIQTLSTATSCASTSRQIHPHCRLTWSHISVTRSPVSAFSERIEFVVISWVGVRVLRNRDETTTKMKLSITTASALLAVLLQFILTLGSTVPAFVWSPHLDMSQAVNYQTISPEDLAKIILSEGGWSELLCEGKSYHKPIDVALVFIGNELLSSGVAANSFLKPGLVDLLKASFTRSNFSIAFPYVAGTPENGRMELSLLKEFEKTCEHGMGVDSVILTGSCSADSKGYKKVSELDSIFDYLSAPTTAKESKGVRNLVVYCHGASDPSTGLNQPKQSESNVLTHVINSVDQAGLKYTAVYVSDPYNSVQYPSSRLIERFLAQGSGNASSNSTCDGVCQIKTSLLEGLFTGLVLLIILISGLCCMMGIDTPTRFEAPQDS
ncbi:hypothetical protein V2J09_015702, partial [Rumex salicifolius]